MGGGRTCTSQAPSAFSWKALGIVHLVFNFESLVCGVMLSDMKSNQLAPARILVPLLCLGLVGCAGLAERWNRAKADDLITDAGKKSAANDLYGNGVYQALERVS
jgi:hypothetical protein